MASAHFILITVLLANLAFHGAQSTVQCNSSVTDDGQDGICTGDYCFNIEDKIRGCVNFYRMIRDDNIACGHMHLLDSSRKVCVCTQPYCSKYAVANMPMQTLANVTCTDDTGSQLDQCTPGPCYVGNDLRRYGQNPSDHPVMQRTCMQDWFAVTNFKQLIMYEVPPLANHSACFFDSDGIFNCMCKDRGCNEKTEPSLPPSIDVDYYTCHKASCQIGVDSGCDDAYLGNNMCLGQMCYFLKTVYDFQLDGTVYNSSHIVRDCLNYSHPDPISDLTFSTGFQFGRSYSLFYPCTGDRCNEKTSDQTTSLAPQTTTPAPQQTTSAPEQTTTPTNKGAPKRAISYLTLLSIFLLFLSQL